MCHVSEVLKVMDDKQRASTQGDRPPDLGEMSLAKVGFAEKSRLLGPEKRASGVGGKLRFAAQRPRAGGEISKDILTFPLSLEAGRAQLGQAEGAKRHLTSTIKKPAWKHGHTWSPGS